MYLCTNKDLFQHFWLLFFSVLPCFGQFIIYFIAEGRTVLAYIQFFAPKVEPCYGLLCPSTIYCLMIFLPICDQTLHLQRVTLAIQKGYFNAAILTLHSKCLCKNWECYMFTSLFSTQVRYSAGVSFDA